MMSKLGKIIPRDIASLDAFSEAQSGHSMVLKKIVAELPE